MTIEELVKALGLEGEEHSDKVKTLTAEWKAKEKEFNELSKKAKELEEGNTKLKEEAETNKAIVDKFNIVSKAFSFDNEAEDFDKMLDDVKDKLSKSTGGASEEELKQLRRDLTKANRELEKSNTSFKELSEKYEAEKNERIRNFKKSAIKKELEEVNALNPEMFVDLFMNKVNVDEDGKTLSMKDDAGNDISVKDGIADWAKANKNLVKANVRGGAGSGGGNGSGGNDGVSDFVKNMIANNHNDNDDGGKSLAEMFG
jgi:predicted RNase H-like nuclease (RuvC/YqgF family)